MSGNLTEVWCIDVDWFPPPQFIFLFLSSFLLNFSPTTTPLVFLFTLFPFSFLYSVECMDINVTAFSKYPIIILPHILKKSLFLQCSLKLQPKMCRFSPGLKCFRGFHGNCSSCFAEQEHSSLGLFIKVKQCLLNSAKHPAPHVTSRCNGTPWIYGSKCQDSLEEDLKSSRCRMLSQSSS